MGFLEGIFYMIWRGLAIGVIISAPMGPVGILCVQRTLEKGRQTGFFTGVGASISDLLYCLLTGFGLSFIEGFLKANQSIIQLLGSLVLIVFGVYLFKTTPARKLKKPGAEKTSPGKNLLSGFLFTFSNPLIIFLIIGLFARFDFFLPEISLLQYLIGYISIVVGALGWWWIVSFFVDKVRAHFNLRSMWLINKITGSIIMIFAVVGIVTALTSKANAHNHNAVYLNASRGYSPLDSCSPGEKLVISNTGPSTVYRTLAVKSFPDFTFSFRCANRHNMSGKTYSYVDSCLAKQSVRHPAWGIILKSAENAVTFRFITTDSHTDDIFPAFFNIQYLAPADSGMVKLTDEVDLYTGPNSFKIRKEGSTVDLLAGNRRYKPIVENLPLGFSPDSISFFIEPGAELSLDCLSLVPLNDLNSPRIHNNSHFALEDVRNSYFQKTSDPLEGEWEIFDRMLDDNRLRMGGNYRFAMVKNRTGYDLVYLSGAQKNPDIWQSGITKAVMNNTSFRHVYDVDWYNVAGERLNAQIKAQFTAPDIIEIQFPDYGNSSLRLRKIKK